MARVAYSPLVVDMRGKISDAVMSSWKGIGYVRSRVTPANPNTASQQAQRNAFKQTLQLWQSIKSWAKAVWNLSASGYPMSGYNYFMDKNVPHQKAAEALEVVLANDKYSRLAAWDCVTGASGHITCNWTHHDCDANDKVVILYRRTNAYAYTEKTRAVLATADTYDLSGLTAGAQYEVAFGAYDSDGTYYDKFYAEILNAGA